MSRRHVGERRLTFSGGVLPSLAGILPHFPKSILNSFGVTRDDCEQDPRRAIRPCAALFPILQCRGLETKSSGEFRLAQAQPPTDRAHVGHRDLNGGRPHGNVFAARPGDRLL